MVSISASSRLVNSSRPELIKMMVGREMTNLFRQRDIGYGDVLLEVKTSITVPR